MSSVRISGCTGRLEIAPSQDVCYTVCRNSSKVMKMVQVADALLAACGLFCGACYHYQASFYEHDRLLEEAARRGRRPEGFTCRGCRSGALYIHSDCAHCEIRACTDRKQIPHCGLCAEFPCDRLRAFQNDGRVHHRDILDQLAALREQGTEEWLTAQEQRWTCDCGQGFSWYQQTCCNCGKAVNSYGADPTLKPHEGYSQEGSASDA